MARRTEHNYVFNKTDKTIKVPGHVHLSSLLMVVNSVSGIIIYNFSDPAKGATQNYSAAYDTDFPTATDGVTTFTLDYDTTSMASEDDLAVYIDDQARGLKIRPYDFGTDAIERMRVSNPQSLIDADFEYGLQSTKWQNLGLNRNIPSFYELPGAGLPVTAIASGGAATYSTVTVTVNVTTGTTLPAAGSPVSMFGLSNSLAEGLFMVLSTGTSSFTYAAKGSISAGSLYTEYVSAKNGAIFDGASLPITSVSGNGAGGVLTIGFGSVHGLSPGSTITISDTSAGTQSHEGSFFVNEVVDGVTVKAEAGQTVTSGAISTATLAVYARNDSFFTHRPFDGGVLLGPFLPSYGLEAKRQTKRYFRYQSGKGLLFSTGLLLNPVFDIQSATYSSPDITVTTELEHGLQSGATVKIYGIDSGNYNGTYIVKSITSDSSFTVEPPSAPTDTTAVLAAQPRLAVTKWMGASVRSGMFDDTNGLFWEYDGYKLYAVKRSSTFQLAGTVSVTNGSYSITGTGTRFTEQTKVGDALVIRGQRYIISSITNNTTISVSPEYRGSTVANVKPALVREVRVAQSDFNYDRLDGTGQSGYTIAPDKMQMMAIQFSWYGAGFIDFMCRGPSGEFIIAHRMPNNNINDEAYMRSGNLPARYEVVNYAAADELLLASGTSGSIQLVDASRFPDVTATNPGYLLLISNQGGTIYQEVISYTGKNGNLLTGTTRGTSIVQYLSGASRTFKGTTTPQNHPVGTAVMLMNTTCAPTISHWGSAVIMDGGFDDDTGYLFSLADYNVTVNANATITVLLFRPAPSISNTLAGALGEREVINRSIITLKNLDILSTQNIEIAGVLNPSNVNNLTWTSASTQSLGNNVNVYQPSFAQYIDNSLFSSAPVNGEVLFRFIVPANRTALNSFELSKVKSIENGILGGNGTFPNGPEVLALVVRNRSSSQALVDFSLTWTEAQA